MNLPPIGGVLIEASAMLCQRSKTAATFQFEDMTMSDDDLLLEEDTDLTSLVRLVTGEYVVGVIDEELSEESGMIAMLNPCVIHFIDGGSKVRISKYNVLGNGNCVLFTDKAVIQFDSPSTPLLKLYVEFVTGEEGSYEPPLLTEDEEKPEEKTKEKRVLH